MRRLATLTALFIVALACELGCSGGGGTGGMGGAPASTSSSSSGGGTSDGGAGGTWGSGASDAGLPCVDVPGNPLLIRLSNTRTEPVFLYRPRQCGDWLEVWLHDVGAPALPLTPAFSPFDDCQFTCEHVNNGNYFCTDCSSAVTRINPGGQLEIPVDGVTWAACPQQSCLVSSAIPTGAHRFEAAVYTQTNASFDCDGGATCDGSFGGVSGNAVTASTVVTLPADTVTITF